MAERLQKILSQWGIASRRQAEQLILEGRVRLNGTVGQLGQKADPAIDAIEVDGKPLQAQHRPELVYLLLNKPLGVVSTCSDPEGRPTVIDLLPDALRSGVYPVGRLDAFSTGALLLTNDGTVTECLTHPRHSVPKTYHVWVEGHPTEAVLQQWRQGVLLEGRSTRPAQVRVLQSNNQETLLEVVLREGRNRQIRRVAKQLGFPVKQLHRTTIGQIQLGQLPIGQYRKLNSDEVDFLYTQVQSAQQ
jgi:pseudouridine synthase